MNKQTHEMLCRLAGVLAQHREGQAPEAVSFQSRLDAEALRRISMILHRWHELECNGDIEQGEVSGKWYSSWSDSQGHRRQSDTPIPDREKGARKRLAAILAKYPGLTAYVQTDPRGAAQRFIFCDQATCARAAASTPATPTELPFTNRETP